MNPRIEEFDLQGVTFDSISDSTLLPDELVKARLSNFAASVGSGVDSAIAAWGDAIELHAEANRLSVPGRPNTMCKSREWKRNTILPVGD